MSFSRCKWKSVSKVREIKTEHEQFPGKGAYVADLEIRHSMELQGAVEVLLNLGADLELRLPDGFLLLLAAEKFQGDPKLDNRPMTGPLRRPRAEYLLEGQREPGDLVGGAGRRNGVDLSQALILLDALR